MYLWERENSSQVATWVCSSNNKRKVSQITNDRDVVGTTQTTNQPQQQQQVYEVVYIYECMSVWVLMSTHKHTYPSVDALLCRTNSILSTPRSCVQLIINYMLA